ncbi:MarR family winged helix-turn-helix transcriptional regulator [Streptococcus saliviloxodontae]|uniref:DNA-binding MarR family transcriptional regulator n=1 Tax=Streptococcus saliviloxodontae TaxID=1349416 RepID=A0ABS2PMZ1_9STRE|nr:MarR family transcriptional regulator [Streptococcus saliviloxodontae]MBM7636804.1 DNA-binding MarR family transcriptional regulator [Streptococcus saliviloxodontae]
MDNQFQEMRNFIAMMEQFVSEKSKEFDVEHLGGPQGFVLMHLLRFPDKDLSFKDIEQYLKISKSVTSNLIKRMEKNGFIHIEPSQKDKRIKYIRLTDFGRGKADRLENFLDYVHGVFLNGISKEDAETTRRVIWEMKSNLSREINKGEEDV